MSSFGRQCKRLLVVITATSFLSLSACSLGAPGPRDGAATPTATRMTASAVDATTLDGKAIFGYQGWFACPGDVPDFDPYGTFFRGAPTAANLNVDFWPDVSDIPPAATCPTSMTLSDGRPLRAFSNFNPAGVDAHFRWMAQYDIDGVALQRFLAGLETAPIRRFRDGVADNVRHSAERYGRTFFVEYALDPQYNPHLVEDVTADWRSLVDHQQLTASSRYQRHNGRPVVGIFGFGFPGSIGMTPAQATALLDYFQVSAPAKYRATVMGGVHSDWRFNTDLSPWRAIILRLNVISPWAVYAYKNNQQADLFAQDHIKPDLELATSKGAAYLPVVWPGFSTSNLFRDRPRNEIPRNGGTFYWRQVYNATSAGAQMLFVAMFDEVNEGTAMFKLVATRQELPSGNALLALDADGYTVPSDWYLRLGGETGKALRGQIPRSRELPLTPSGAPA